MYLLINQQDQNEHYYSQRGFQLQTLPDMGSFSSQLRVKTTFMCIEIWMPTIAKLIDLKVLRGPQGWRERRSF
jgi:hypothetical protein